MIYSFAKTNFRERKQFGIKEKFAEKSSGIWRQARRSRKYRKSNPGAKAGAS